jgi:hypothetical protein
MAKKISDLTAISGGVFASGDLFEISVDTGGGYVSRKITGTELLASIPSSGGETLAQTLAIGNDTSGNIINITSGDYISYNHSGFINRIITDPLTTINKTQTLQNKTGTLAHLDDTLESADITITDANRAITLNGSTSADKITIDNGTNDALIVQGDGQVYSYGKGFGSTNTAFGSGVFANTTPANANNTGFGRSVLANLTTGGSNTGIGSEALSALTTGYSNMALGYQALQYITGAKNSNVGVGSTAGRLITAGTNNTGTSDSLFLGFDSRPSGATDSNTIVIGSQSRGNGSNTTTIGTTSTTANYIYGDFNVTDADNFIIGTTTGTKIGTATSQKIGFWNTTPIIQPTTGVAAATFTANTSGIADDTATFDGYTIGQVVKALRNTGLLA